MLGARGAYARARRLRVGASRVRDEGAHRPRGARRRMVPGHEVFGAGGGHGQRFSAEPNGAKPSAAQLMPPGSRHTLVPVQRRGAAVLGEQDDHLLVRAQVLEATGRDGGLHRWAVEELLDDPTSSARHPGGRSAAQPMGGGKDVVRSWGDISLRSHSGKGPGG